MESSRLQKIAAIPDKIVNITNLQDATKNKISLSENLQDAYKQIETIEAQAILIKQGQERGEGIKSLYFNGI